MTLLILLFSLAIDQMVGEVKKWHPLVGFGLLANKTEAFLRLKNNDSVKKQRLFGVLALLLVTLPFVFLSYLLVAISESFLVIHFAINVIILYFAIGAKSLKQHALNIYRPLIKEDFTLAKSNTQFIVSRDTRNMSENDISKAAIESVLENGNDAIFGVIFWFVIAGAPGAVFFRLVNTLDAMWGYRTERFLHFGWAAAKLDDGLNYIPARLTALSYAVVGYAIASQFKRSSFKNALFCWRTQSYHWDSPNAGPVMAAGAGALSIKLGGAATYHGEMIRRPILGINNEAKADDIMRAITLVDRSILLWVAVIGFFSLGGYWFA